MLAVVLRILFLSLDDDRGVERDQQWQAAGVLATVQRDNIEAAGKQWSQEEEDAFKAPILEKYEKESHAYYSSARLWDDGIIKPSDTRRMLGMSFAACKQDMDTDFGVFRM